MISTDLPVLTPDLSIDAQLIESLAQALPHYLVERDGLDPVTARAFARPLADQLVARAHERNQLHLLRELPRRLDTGEASAEEREAFQLVVEGLAILHASRVSPANCEVIARASARLWDVLAREMNNGWPRL